MTQNVLPLFFIEISKLGAVTQSSRPEYEEAREINEELTDNVHKAYKIIFIAHSHIHVARKAGIPTIIIMRHNFFPRSTAARKQNYLCHFCD